MRKIGILRGQEDSFPDALIQRINRMGVEDVQADFIEIDGVKEAPDFGDYRVILDRISQDIPFYRSMLKNAMLNGVRVVNNPFWWSADDKFFGYCLLRKIGINVPRTVLLPNRDHTPDTDAKSYRNLKYPLSWEDIFDYIGFPAFMKPHAGGGWKHVYKIHNREEFFHYYNQTGDLCMMLQEGIEFERYYRCYGIGYQHVWLMEYDPLQPHHLRYVRNPQPIPSGLEAQMRNEVTKICSALGYDFNTVEFAIRDGVPYAIDFTNPAPDCDIHSVTEENFYWVLDAASQYLVELAQQPPLDFQEYRWSHFLQR
ncbi:MAG: hypothetical protein D6675_15165 [Gemmatimonadetes bacterium]|nr:MAG: hypothetical protein D6675_15165 [Gemmatimonadota bacterium]